MQHFDVVTVGHDLAQHLDDAVVDLHGEHVCAGLRECERE